MEMKTKDMVAVALMCIGSWCVYHAYVLYHSFSGKPPVLLQMLSNPVSQELIFLFLLMQSAVEPSSLERLLFLAIVRRNSEIIMDPNDFQP